MLNCVFQSLFFAGVNADQCVCSELMLHTPGDQRCHYQRCHLPSLPSTATYFDAYNKVYDVFYLRDLCATNSPPFCREAMEYNAKLHGFVLDSKQFAEGLSRGDK